jgi:chromosome segregation ATPase
MSFFINGDVNHELSKSLSRSIRDLETNLYSANVEIVMLKNERTAMERTMDNALKERNSLVQKNEDLRKELDELKTQYSNMEMYVEKALSFKNKKSSSSSISFPYECDDKFCLCEDTQVDEPATKKMKNDK